MLIRRDLYLNKLIEAIDNKQIKIITGLRRSGKSFLLFNIFYAYLLSNKIKKDHIIAIQLDRLSMNHLCDPDKLCNFVLEQIKDKEKYFVLIDEIQLCNKFEPVLNEFLHYDNLEIYVTGSNSKFLSSDIITEFRGRGYQIHLYPLSFKEFYATGVFKDFNQALEQYYLFGSMPYIFYKKDNVSKQQYLKELIDETYIKDIVNRHNIQSDKVLYELLNILASSIGSYTSIKKLTNTFNTNTKSSVSENTIKTYINYLEDAFLIKKVCKYDIKGKRYINSPYKYYFTDLGLRNALLNFRQIDKSRLMENLIYNQLLIRGYSVDVGSIEINERQKDKTYVRKQLECDFVLNLGYQRVYIQSCYSLLNNETSYHETRSLINIKDSFKKMIVVNDNVYKHADDNGIIYISLAEFLLDEPIENMFNQSSQYDWDDLVKIINKYKINNVYSKD